jgi:hypothetical protein
MPLIVFDLDGTLANLDHRLWHIEQTPKDWESFYADCAADTPIEPIAELARQLDTCLCYDLLVLSGRSEAVRTLTEDWMRKHRIPWRYLVMRPEGNHEPDHTLKPKMLAEWMAKYHWPAYDLAFIVEDRTSVVKAWRALGYTCLQCADGDF